MKEKSYLGTISINSKLTGYVNIEPNKKIKDKKSDIEVNFADLNTALHGDTVRITIEENRNRNFQRKYGKVLEVVSRAKKGFVGILIKDKNTFLLKADDQKLYPKVIIEESNLNDAKVGDKIYVEITQCSKENFYGKVLKTLGKPGENNTEMFSIAVERGFDSHFPIEVENESRKIEERGITENDLKDRKDFREVLTFTIDPDDAKDFDDAISFKEIDGKKYEVGIHIADVSNYVKIGSKIDEEAQKRATSVYLVDRTIPMLPEALSNDLCSLVPNKDRLCMSAVFVLDENANIENEWYGKTVIHSKKRFTYKDAEESIKNENGEYHRELSILNNIAKKLHKERFKNGALSLDSEEVKFVLDEKGIPTKVIVKQRGDSNKLIEELMLLANKKVAEKMSLDENKKKLKTPNGGVFVYRIHDLPDQKRMEDLVFFLKSLGYKTKLKNGIIPSHELNKILESLEGKNERESVHRFVIRSMAKAIYSTDNIGHYGLAFPYYTHFTSPIRRYPDVVVHRLLQDVLENKKINKEKWNDYEKICISSSDQEKRAADAERASIKYKQVEYMSSRIGKTFEGIISSVVEWGIYIEEVETKCEGLVRISELKDDYYIFDEKKIQMVGKKKKKIYKLGEKVKIKVKNVDTEKKTIDYEIVS